MKKSIAMTLLHIKIFSVHALLLKRKFQHVGHKWVIAMWVTSGLFCGSVSQLGQQVQPTFNPELCILCLLSYLFTNFIIVIEFISAIYDDNKYNWFVVNIYMYMVAIDYTMGIIDLC